MLKSKVKNHTKRKQLLFHHYLSSHYYSFCVHILIKLAYKTNMNYVDHLEEMDDIVDLIYTFATAVTFFAKFQLYEQTKTQIKHVLIDHIYEITGVTSAEIEEYESELTTPSLSKELSISSSNSGTKTPSLSSNISESIESTPSTEKYHKTNGKEWPLAHVFFRYGPNCFVQWEPSLNSIRSTIDTVAYDEFEKISNITVRSSKRYKIFSTHWRKRIEREARNFINFVANIGICLLILVLTMFIKIFVFIFRTSNSRRSKNRRLLGRYFLYYCIIYIILYIYIIRVYIFESIY